MKNRLVFAVALVLPFLEVRGEEAAPSPSPAPAPPALETIVLRDGFWQGPSKEAAEGLMQLKFAWMSEAKNAMRSSDGNLQFGGFPLSEALFSYQNDWVTGATLMFYSRGDMGDLNEREFDQLLAGVTARLTALLGVSPTELGRDSASAVKAERREWRTPVANYLLEWSTVQKSVSRSIAFRAEFIRLTIQPGAGGGEQAGSRDVVKKFVGKDHVERLPQGAKLKDVPMVDQGQKGYCVSATVERVMKYFGARVDQYEMAQITNTETGGGASSAAMTDSLKKLTARLGVKVKDIIAWDARDMPRTIADYNRATKRGKLAPEIPPNIYVVEEIYRRMKPELYKEVRLKQSADFGKFQREVQRSIDEGIPLIWSVIVGMVAEKEIPQAFGGHMRLIIGYDNAAKEIIYSDSWGYGHEEKRMTMEDAWAMTTDLSQILPIGS